MKWSTADLSHQPDNRYATVLDHFYHALLGPALVQEDSMNPSARQQRRQDIGGVLIRAVHLRREGEVCKRPRSIAYQRAVVTSTFEMMQMSIFGSPDRSMGSAFECTSHWSKEYVASLVESAFTNGSHEGCRSRLTWFQHMSSQTFANWSPR